MIANVDSAITMIDFKKYNHETVDSKVSFVAIDKFTFNIFIDFLIRQ